MKLYKLTDENGRTQNNTQWGEGVTHTATGDPSQPLCRDAWIHAYEHPLIAVFVNPAQADFKNPRLWEAEGEIVKQEGQLKCGCRSLTTVMEMPLPVITTEQRVEIAIRCTKLVCKGAAWNRWADDWLSGRDRSAAASASVARSAAWVVEAVGTVVWAETAEMWAAHAPRAEIDLVAIISTVVNPNTEAI